MNKRGIFGLVVLALALTICSAFVACSAFRNFVSLGLANYEPSVIAGTPTNLTVSPVQGRWFDQATLDGERVKIFNNDEEPGNIVGEVRALDALIEEINNKVSNTNEGQGVDVVEVPDGAVTLPFFGDRVEVSHALVSDPNPQVAKKAAYKITSDRQTVILFETFPPMDWNGVLVQDHALFYGTKTDATVDIWQAFIGVDSSTHEKVKGWAFKIHIDGQQYFTVHHDSSYTCSTASGQPKGYFLLRQRQSLDDFPTSSPPYGRVHLYNYNGGAYTIEAELSLPAGDEIVAYTDIPKPSSIDESAWTKMIDFINTTNDPDATPCPPSLTGFDSGFLPL